MALERGDTAPSLGTTGMQKPISTVHLEGGAMGMLWRWVPGCRPDGAACSCVGLVCLECWAGS